MGVDAMSRKIPLGRRRARSKHDGRVTAGPQAEVPEPELNEFEEFRNADRLPLKASPEFKEGLREKLRKLLKSLYGALMLFLGGPVPYN